MWKYSKSLALVVAILSIISCGQKKNAAEPALQLVKTDTVRAVGMGSQLQLPGKVVAAQEVNASFKVAGTLRRVYVEKGQRVKAGQLLAEMDASDYKVQLSATEAEYAQIKADAERIIGLYNDGGTTASNYDKARYGLQQIEAKLQNHRNQVSYCKIYAPFSGCVQQTYFEGGETVAAGMPIVSILSDGALEVEVNLPASAYTQREQFGSYSCSLNVLPEKQLPLQLISILPRANANQLYTMRLRMNGGGDKVAPGMSAWVTVQMTGDESSLVRIPTTALLEEDGKTFAFSLQNGKIHKEPIEVKSLHTDGSATVEGALKVGGLIVSSGVHHLADGQRVKPMEPASKTNVGGLL